MSYLRLIKTTMQDWAETMASALNVDVAIADKNLTRIVGTGNFYNRIDEDCPEDSLFAKVIETGLPKINLIAKDGSDCINCSKYDTCQEHSNMSYPLTVDDEVIGVISFASFDSDQAGTMSLKKDEYFKVLKQNAEMIEKEISRVKMTNELKRNITEVNEIINCLNKGIIFLNSKREIMHINVKALDILEINPSEQKIMDRPIKDIIKNIKLNETGDNDLVGYWKINEKDMRIRYKINKITLENNKFSTMISFDKIKEIIDIAKTYVNKDKIIFSNIIGKSEALLKPINKAKIAAVTDSTILIQGESGTGKELLARSIHNESPRKDGPMIIINCAGIPESLIESELFGYERGAFTGANPGGKKGKIELANNGTLFLDEIGDLPLHMQTKLLRVLQERRIDRVGGDGKGVDVNIRVIAATHRNLQELVNEGKFRLDLFYRLNVIPIELPPLKDRDEDIFLCSEYIIHKLCRKMDKDDKVLSERVKQEFKKYSWPGNLRELENILEYGICFATDNEIRLEHMPKYFFENQIVKVRNDTLEDKTFNIEEFEKEIIDEKYLLMDDKNLEELKIQFEKDIIEKLINTYGDTLEGKKMVAEKLNIGLSTLYRKMNAYTN